MGKFISHSKLNIWCLSCSTPVSPAESTEAVNWQSLVLERYPDQWQRSDSGTFIGVRHSFPIDLGCINGSCCKCLPLPVLLHRDLFIYLFIMTVALRKNRRNSNILTCLLLENYEASWKSWVMWKPSLLQANLFKLHAHTTFFS